jgi:CheY-like chemotaxis protein
MTIKLLVADDSATIYKIVSLTFAGEDTIVERVSTGQAVVERARSLKPDIVLVDLSMPGLNGYQLCRTIKSDPDLGGTRVVLLVGSMDRFDEAEAARVNCDAHLTKPFGTSELTSVVGSLCRPERVDAEEAGHLVSARTRESFLGTGRLLDAFGGLIPLQAPESGGAGAGRQSERLRAFSPVRVETGGMPEKVLDAIVERVIRRMSQDVVRTVAWEVVPEMSELLIRQWLKEHRPAAAEFPSAAPAESPERPR